MPGLEVALTVVDPSDEPGREIGDDGRWFDCCNCCTTSARKSKFKNGREFPNENEYVFFSIDFIFQNIQLNLPISRLRGAAVTIVVARGEAVVAIDTVVGFAIGPEIIWPVFCCIGIV